MAGQTDINHQKIAQQPISKQKTTETDRDTPFTDAAWSPRVLHPLMGADLQTLFQVLRRNGGVSLRCLPHIGVAIATCLARQPISAIESWRIHRLRQQGSEIDPPIFIVGHWRSGTTFLYELLCQSPQFNYVSPLRRGSRGIFSPLPNIFNLYLKPYCPRIALSIRFR